MRGIKNLRPLSSFTKKRKEGRGETWSLACWARTLTQPRFFPRKKRKEGNFFEGINFEREEEENFFPFWKSGLVESTTAWVCAVGPPPPLFPIVSQMSERRKKNRGCGGGGDSEFFSLLLRWGKAGGGGDEIKKFFVC